MAVIEAYVTNLGKYNEGELASEPLKFPTTTEEVQALLKRIGVDNIQYEEIFIADYDGDLPELNACLGEYESIDELNHLACLLSELDKSDLEKFEALLPAATYLRRGRPHQSGGKIWIATISISACLMMKPWAAFTRRTWN